MSIDHSTDRRSFLTTLATSSAALAAAGVVVPFAARDAHAEPTDTDGFSEAWLAKLTGKHKQFFDATTVNNGFGLVFAMNFVNANMTTYKLPESQISTVVGLRHFAAPMGFTDQIWSRYKIGETLGIMDPKTKQPSTRNFLYHPQDGDLVFPECAIEKLLARGVQFTVCNVALTALSGMMSKNAGVTPDAARQEWLAGMIPGTTLVPAGVLAVNRAQEKGCTYCNGG